MSPRGLHRDIRGLRAANGVRARVPVRDPAHPPLLGARAARDSRGAREPRGLQALVPRGQPGPMGPPRGPRAGVLVQRPRGRVHLHPVHAPPPPAVLRVHAAAPPRRPGAAPARDARGCGGALLPAQRADHHLGHHQPHPASPRARRPAHAAHCVQHPHGPAHRAGAPRVGAHAGRGASGAPAQCAQGGGLHLQGGEPERRLCRH
mmetsp:Transcript_11316/g.38564  ORF Transcript_11316/g.38564 Transcript_11316/m.38564 type:complete len:205 (-) Transcript_11316:1316-1930(-)